MRPPLPPPLRVLAPLVLLVGTPALGQNAPNPAPAPAPPRAAKPAAPAAAPIPIPAPAPSTAPARSVTPPLAQAPAPAPPADDAADDPWEERKIRSREEVSYLEVLVQAKQAEVRESELRVQIFSDWQAEQERIKRKGLITPFQHNINTVNVAEYESEAGLRRVELKDAEIRLARARRRLKSVERSGAAPAEDPNDARDERLRTLEQMVDRLRKELDRNNRTAEASRHTDASQFNPIVP